MSVRVMTAVWAITLPDSEKLVLLALADCANDEGVCWPSMATLAAKCSKSDRTVQAAIKALVGKGHLTRNEILGKGCNYTVHPRSGCAPEAAAPRKDFTPEAIADTPEAASDKPSRTIIPKKDKPSLGKRATKIPSDFAPVMSGKTASVVAGWPPGKFADVVEHFIDHHTAKGTLSHDWQASWRTWVKNDAKWEPRNGRSNGKPLGGNQSSDGLSPTTRAARRVFGAPEAGHERAVRQ
jgi:hypothetical protein